MRVLSIDTSGEACSVALFDGDELIARDHRVIGRGHAEALIPMIEALPDKGKAERILVSLGPGSFTGVRIGVAAARALGFAWGAQVLGFPTLALIAAMARQQINSGNEDRAVTVCMNGGHGEWFVQDFNKSGHAQGTTASLSPAEAAVRNCHKVCAGNRANELAAKPVTGSVHVFDCIADASKTVLLPKETFITDLSPIYGRAPDAKPQKAKPT